MLKDLAFCIVIVLSFISHQLLIICSEFSRNCPEIEDYDIIAKIPLIKVLSRTVYKYCSVNESLLPLIALLGKAGFWVMTLFFLYMFVVLTYDIMKTIMKYGFIIAGIMILAMYFINLNASVSS